MKNQKELDKLLSVSLSSLSYVAKANYPEREDEAIASFNKAFNECFYAQDEPTKEKMHKFYKSVIEAIEYVGSANYSEREKEARKKINDAFEQL